MQSPVDLKQMSVPDKLRLVEALWDELCSREEEIPVPDWNHEIDETHETEVSG